MSECLQQQFDYRALQRTKLLASGSLATVTATGAPQGKKHTEDPWQKHTVGAQNMGFYPKERSFLLTDPSEVSQRC